MYAARYSAPNVPGLDRLLSESTGRILDEFVAIWLDNMSTAISFATGKSDGSGSQVFPSEQLTPAGEKVTTRSLRRTIDEDHHTYESYITKPGGKELLHMRVECTRVDDCGETRESGWGCRQLGLKWVASWPSSSQSSWRYG
jgi:hypothetical protein